MNITIIGGGIIGLSSAYYLQKKGYHITIVDKGDITKGCSFGNAGYVSPSHFTPLATPGIIAQGLRWMLSSTSPFYIKPRMNLDLLQWGINFWKSANKATVEKNIPHMNNLLQLSRQLTAEMKNELGNNFRMQEKGCFMLYKTADTEKHELELAEKAAHFGIETKILTAAEIQALEPNVEVNVKGGVLYPIDAHLHPGELMKTLLTRLISNGATILLNTSVLDFEKNDGKISGVITDKGKVEGDEIVLAAGSWLTLLSKKLGIRILMQAGKGYSMTFDDVKRNLSYPAILVDDRVAMTPLGKDLRMGGTMEISGINEKILTKRANAIFAAAKRYYPDLPLQLPDVDTIWSGLRPLTPDGMPYIGRHSKYKNLIIAGGHAMLGLSMAAGTGKLVEHMINSSQPPIPIDAFSVERFN